ncbi:MAG: tetratricopeptide repeat protein, partial [Candidatus Spechtbacterales bacterium]|nr:tetratricopeptide repeat protein [Candidatus Spechtbacterales bacterium]
FLGAIIISSIFSQARRVSFLSFSPDSFFWVGMYVIAFFAPILLLKSKKSFKNVALAFMGGIGLLALFSYLQLSDVFIFPWDFAQGVGFSPAGSVFAAGFLSAAAFAAIVAYVSIADIKKNNRLALWVVAAIFGLMILQINLWSIWASLAAAFVLVAIVAGARTLRQKEPSLQLLLAPFFVIMLSLFFMIIGPNVPSFLAGTAEVGMPLDATLDIAADSLQGIRWISGTGPGTFSYNYALHRPADLNQTNFWSLQFGQGYSALSTYLSTWGILGVIAFIAFIAVIIGKIISGLTKNSDQKYKDNPTFYALAVSALAVIGVLTTALFFYRGNAVMHLFLFLAAGTSLAALARIRAFKRFKLNVTKNPQVMIVSSLLALAVISVAFGGLYLVGQKYIAQAHLASAVKIYQTEQSADKTLEKLQKALNINPSDDAILRTTAQAFILKMAEIAESQELRQEDVTQQFSATFESALSAARQATVANPKELKNWTQLASVLSNAIGLAEGAEDGAISAYNEAIKLAPNDPSLPLAQARVYLNAADVIQAQLGALAQSGQGEAQQEKQLAEKRITFLNKAVEKIEESLALKQDYTTARLLLASAYQRLGELDKAIAETRSLAEIAPNDPNLAFQLGLLYWQKEEHENARIQLERAITLADGDFANARYYLGLAYFELDNRPAAVGQFEILVKDNPDNELVKTVLDNLKNGRGPFEQVQPPQDEAPIEEQPSEEPALSE